MNHSDDADLVSLREAARRLGIHNLNAYFAKYGSRPEPDTETATGPVKLYRMAAVRGWYETTVKNPRQKG